MFFTANGNKERTQNYDVENSWRQQTLKNENESERIYSWLKDNRLRGREMNVAGSSSCPIRGDFESPDIGTGELDCISLLIRCNLPYTHTPFICLLDTRYNTRKNVFP